MARHTRRDFLLRSAIVGGVSVMTPTRFARAQDGAGSGGAPQTPGKSGLAGVSFELLAESQIKAGARPSGQPGTLSKTEDAIWNVTFPAGCVLRIERGSQSGDAATYRASILESSLSEPFLILIRLRMGNQSQPYFMIPGALYGTNNAQRIPDPFPFCGGDAKLDYRGDAVNVPACASPCWHFRADRSGVPSVIAIFDGHIAALGIKEASVQTDGSWVYNSLGIWTAADGDSISIAMGTLDWPGRIITHKLGDAPGVEALPATAAAGLTTEFCLFDGPASDRFAYEPFVEGWTTCLHEPPREGAELVDTMRVVGDALVDAGIDPESGYFHMYLTPDGIQRQACTLLAWAGVFQICRPLAMTGRILGNAKQRDTAMAMTDRAVEEAFNPQLNLFYDCYLVGKGWQPNLWRPDLGYTALINGHACYLLMKMYEDEPAHKSWGERAGQVLDHALKYQREDGRFPGGFSTSDGTPLTYDTYGGCFFVAPLLIRHRLFGAPAARDAAIRALDHYWDEFARLEWVGVDLDCNGAVDSGSSYALVRALVELHRQTGDAAILEKLGHVLHYACTYHFVYNTRHRNPVCSWSSSGAKITSTHNVHLDAHVGEFLEDVVYYVKQTNDAYFRERIEDAVQWARQAYNRTEAEYGWGKKGWATEQYYHTYDHYHFDIGDGTVWVAYFPWAIGALLNAYVVEHRMKNL